MSKPIKGRSPRRKAASRIPRKGSGTKKRPNPENASSKSKQSRAIAMLRSDGGASIATLVKVMGWQQHSVRGFLAGVVRKRLGLKLEFEQSRWMPNSIASWAPALIWNLHEPRAARERYAEGKGGSAKRRP